MTEQDANSTVGELLGDHPEYRLDVATMPIDGEPMAMLSTDGLLAFIDWSLAKGHVADRAKAREFKKRIREGQWRKQL